MSDILMMKAKKGWGFFTLNQSSENGFAMKNVLKKNKGSSNTIRGGMRNFNQF